MESPPTNWSALLASKKKHRAKPRRLAWLLHPKHEVAFLCQAVYNKVGTLTGLMAGRKVKMRSMWRYHAPNPKKNKFKRMDFEEEIFFLRASANEWLYC